MPRLLVRLMEVKKRLNVVEPTGASADTTTVSFEKPAPKGAVKLVDNVDALIDLLHNEAKAI